MRTLHYQILLLGVVLLAISASGCQHHHHHHHHHHHSKKPKESDTPTKTEVITTTPQNADSVLDLYEQFYNCLCSLDPVVECNISYTPSANQNVEDAVSEIMGSKNITQFNNYTCTDDLSESNLCAKMLEATTCSTTQTTQKEFMKCHKCVDINWHPKEGSQVINRQVCSVYCDDIPLITTTTDKDGESNSKTFLIIGIVAATFVLIALITIFVIVLRRRKRKKKQSKDFTSQLKSSVVQVQDRTHENVSETKFENPYATSNNLPSMTSEGYENTLSETVNRPGANEYNEPVRSERESKDSIADIDNNNSKANEEDDLASSTTDKAHSTETGTITAYNRLGDEVKNITDPYDALDTQAEERENSPSTTNRTSRC